MDNGRSKIKGAFLGFVAGLIGGYFLAFLIAAPLALLWVPFGLADKISIDTADNITNVIQIITWVLAVIFGVYYGKKRYS